jgi:hypothetical protein
MDNLGKIKINKKEICSLSLILLLAMPLMIAFAPNSLAQVGVAQPEKTEGYISVAPTLIGVGQTATVNLWVFPLPNTYNYQAYYGGFTGVTVTFEKPDGTKDTFMPVDGTGSYAAGQTESIGAIFFFYAPDMAGEWSVSFTMPTQNITDSSGTVSYQSCTSDPAYFTVTEEEQLAGLLNGYPWGQLPNEDVYWSYPINSNNREWSAISGDWLGGSGFTTMNLIHGVTCRLWQPYGSSPNTAHVVWKHPLRSGGLIGGDYGSLSYTTALNLQTGVILEGKLFASISPPISAYNVNKFVCIDLTTGELLYTADGSIAGGVHLPGNAYAQSALDSSVVLASSFGAATTSYLFGTTSTTWNYYDPLTGSLVRSIVNASSGFRVVDGTNLAYGTAKGNLTAWDISKVVGNNWPTGITWTRSLPSSLTGSSTTIFGISTDASTIVLMTNPNQYWGFSATDGTSLWNLTLTYPASTNEQVSLYGVDDFVVLDPTEATFKCYSMLTGNLLWTSPSYADSPWATTWTVYNSQTNDLDNLYLALPDGTISALSLETGKEVWRSTAFPSTEYTNNVVPYVTGMVMVGGNIYAYAGYSIGYQINPMPRQAMLVCVNATTGDVTWTLNGGVCPVAAANGYIVGFGQNDGNLYCLGKGQTSTSVVIQNNVVANHATALITGNVLDQSPAAAGTPAVADSSVSEWMDYLHMQNSTLLNNPPTPEGVQVTLTALYPDGSTQTIGTTTTDSEGNYAVNFVPEMTGMYTITASFAGTNGYYASDSEAHLSVVAASETTPDTVAQNTADNTMLLYGIMVLVVIAIVLAALALIRKK